MITYHTTSLLVNAGVIDNKYCRASGWTAYLAYNEG